jgi:hypothetical protein
MKTEYEIWERLNEVEILRETMKGTPNWYDLNEEYHILQWVLIDCV